MQKTIRQYKRCSKPNRNDLGQLLWQTSHAVPKIGCENLRVCPMLFWHLDLYFLLLYFYFVFSASFNGRDLQLLARTQNSRAWVSQDDDAQILV